jgi:hypothetical protein
MDLGPLSSLRGWVTAFAAATGLVLVLGVSESLDSSRPGLAGAYFSNAAWTPPAVLTIRGNQPSTEGVLTAWRNAPPDTFSVRWTGTVLALRSGTYAFATDSDDGSSVAVDRRVVVQDSRPHDRASAIGTLSLSRGVHRIAIDYVQSGGPFHFDLWWAYENEAMTPVPSWALLSDRGNPARLVASAALGALYTFARWLSFATLVAAMLVGCRRGIGALVRVVAPQCDWASLKWILVGSLVLNAVGIWWGLPGSWVPIEQTPKEILSALSQHFSHGVDAYPPLHYYVATVVLSPMLLLHAYGLVGWDQPAIYSILTLLCRAISLAAAVGTVVAACLCATRAFGRRAGVFAAAAMALANTFVYYAKTANIDVPYVGWWAISMIFYLRLLEGDRLSDYVWFAIFGALSIATKDQAYALYLFVPIVIVWRRRELQRAGGAGARWWRAVVDPRLGIAAAIVVAALAVFENPLFNWTGLVTHLQAAVGPASKDYQMFNRTASGYLDLLALTTHLTQTALGWPLFLISLAGIGIALSQRELRQTSVWLLAPALSYYVSFLSVIMYTYERYILPFCFVLALFAGLAFDRFLQSRGRRWRTALVTLVFAYSILYATTVDALMMGDARYEAERWMHANVRRDERVGVTELPVLLPTLEDFSTVDIPSIEDLTRERPSYFVLNADYGRAAPRDSPMGQLIEGLQNETIGYRLVHRYRWESPWSWLPLNDPALVGGRLSYSTEHGNILRDVNPTIEIYQRAVSADGARAR